MKWAGQISPIRPQLNTFECPNATRITESQLKQKACRLNCQLVKTHCFKICRMDITQVYLRNTLLWLPKTKTSNGSQQAKILFHFKSVCCKTHPNARNFFQVRFLKESNHNDTSTQHKQPWKNVLTVKVTSCPLFVAVRRTFLPSLRAEILEIKVCPSICACLFSEEFNIHSTIKTHRLKTLTRINASYCLFNLKVPPFYGV